MTIYRVLENINNVLQLMFISPDSFRSNEQVTSEISNCLGINKLRTEFIDFYKNNNISINIILNDNLWKIILLFIIKDLVGKEIKFPEKYLNYSNANLNKKGRKIKKICDRMKNTAFSNKLYVQTSDNPNNEEKLLPMFVSSLMICKNNNVLELAIFFTYNHEGENKYPFAISRKISYIPTILNISM